MNPIVLVSLLALGLALLLARENRLRRAFQDLVNRLLLKLREQPGDSHPLPPHRPRRHP